MDRRSFLIGSASIGALAAVGAGATTASALPEHGAATAGHMRSLTAITQVFGEGQKLIAVAVEYDEAVSSRGLATSTYAVAGRTVTRVYPSATPKPGDRTARTGRYVIVELSPDDASALLWVQLPSSGPGPGAGGPQVGDSTPGYQILPASATLRQAGTVTTAQGRWYPPVSESIGSSRVHNLVVDEFTQHTFHDTRTGRSLGYNLFLPRGYDRRKRYPLVLFMHDAGVIAVSTEGPLVQGLGAVSWASPEDQARHECIVVAPEYPEVVIGDDYLPSTYFDATYDLLQDLIGRYAVDTRRLHLTGQSMGAMMTLGLNIAHPGLFASSFVVAGQWPADQAAPLAKQKLWIVVSQDDDKAYPAENAIMQVVEGLGTKVSTAAWNGSASPAGLEVDARELAGHHAPINYASFVTGTLPTATQAHPETWRIAYTIPEIRDWVLRQSR